MTWWREYFRFDRDQAAGGCIYRFIDFCYMGHAVGTGMQEEILSAFVGLSVLEQPSLSSAQPQF